MITLEEAKVGMADKVDQTVIDEFRRSSLLLDALVFDDAVSPGTGGSTLTYGYIRTKTPSTAKVRKINEEYKPGEAKREEKTAKAVIFGGSFELDRVIANTSGAVDELSYQLQDHIKSAKNLFHYLVINGDSTDSGSDDVKNTFDGLSKILKGSETEYTTEIDVSTSELTDKNYNAVLDEIDAFIERLDGVSMLLMNSDALTKVRACARRAGFYHRETNGLGVNVEYYGKIPMLDMGKYYNGTKTVDVIPTSEEGKTDIYAVSIEIGGFHGISPSGSKIVETYLPDLKAPGAVKKGEVELIAGTVLKNTNKAGVLRGLQVKAVSEAV